MTAGSWLAVLVLFGAGGSSPVGAVLFSDQGVLYAARWGLTETGDVWAVPVRGGGNAQPGGASAAEPEPIEAAASRGAGGRVVLGTRQMALVQAIDPGQAGAGGKAHLVLDTGEVLAGRIADSGRAGGVRFESELFGSAWYGFDRIRRIEYGPIPADLRESEPPFVVLRNNDVLSGTIKAVGASGVTITSVFGPTQIEPARLAAVVFAGEGEQGTRPDGGLLVELKDGQRFLAETLTGQHTGIMLIARRAGREAKLSVRAIRRVVFAGWSYRYLSGLAAPQIETTPYFDEPVRVVLDRNLAGGPLFLSGHSYARGLSTAPKSRVRFAIDGRFDFLWARVGLDPFLGRLGRCDVRVEADGREVFSRSGLTAAMGAQCLAGVIRGAKRLELITDFGACGSLGDCVNWCDAIVIGRSKPGAQNPP